MTTAWRLCSASIVDALERVVRRGLAFAIIAATCALLVGCGKGGSSSAKKPSREPATDGAARSDGATVLVSGGWPTSLVVDDAALYWLDNESDVAYKASKDGKDILRLPGGHFGSSLEQDDQFLYLYDREQEAIVRLAKSGKSPPAIVVKTGGPGYLTVDPGPGSSGNVMWFSSFNARLLTVPKGGGTPTELVYRVGVAGVANTGSPAVDATHIYLGYERDKLSVSRQRGLLLRLPKQGGRVEMIKDDFALSACDRLLVDRAYIHCAADGLIRQVDHSGGGFKMLASDVTGGVDKMVQDADFIYAEIGNWSSGPGIFRIAKKTGETRVIVPQDRKGLGIGDLAVDGRFVYWSQRTSIMRKAK